MTSDEIEKYTKRSFSIDCPQMVLRKTTESPYRVYEGPGRIYQTPEGNLMFKLYASGKPDYSALARHFGQDSIKPGEIVPHHEYFSLEATSLRGETWRGDFILPELNQGVAYGPVVTGDLYTLTKIDSDPHSKDLKPHMSLIFAEDFDFPGNTPTTTKTFLGGVETSMSGDWTPAVFEAAGLEFHLQKVRGSVSLSGQSKNMILPQHLDLRICEALEFTLFEPERWVIRTVCENGQITTTLRRFPKERANKTPRPPLGFRSYLNSKHVWNLFGKYLEYVITHPKAEWHPLSENVHVTVVGDASSIDTGLLALAVAVEGVLKAGFPKLAVPDASLFEQIDAGCKLISESALKDSFKQRVLGALNAMRASRAKDKLLALQKADVIRTELTHAWENTRHPSVHADGLDKTEIAEVYRNYQSALTLFNELVFLIVGYSGQYTDYSVPGWPLRDFQKSMKDVESVRALLVGPHTETHES